MSDGLTIDTSRLSNALARKNDSHLGNAISFSSAARCAISSRSMTSAQKPRLILPARPAHCRPELQVH